MKHIRGSNKFALKAIEQLPMVVKVLATSIWPSPKPPFGYKDYLGNMKSFLRRQIESVRFHGSVEPWRVVPAKELNPHVITFL
jgi:hypothetical protein